MLKNEIHIDICWQCPSRFCSEGRKFQIKGCGYSAPFGNSILCRCMPNEIPNRFHVFWFCLTRPFWSETNINSINYFFSESNIYQLLLSHFPHRPSPEKKIIGQVDFAYFIYCEWNLFSQEKGVVYNKWINWFLEFIPQSHKFC